MKKLIKLAVSLFICGLILLCGCGKTSAPSLPDDLKAPNTDYPNTINIIAPEFFAGLSADDTEIKQQWLDEMSQRYGVNLNIISNYYTSSGDFDHSAGDKAQDILAGNDTTYKGLFRIFGSSMDSSVRVGIEYDTIVPLEDYLTDISQELNARIIHNEALRETDITVTDLDSFLDFAVAYTKKTKNVVINRIDPIVMTDILNAFGLYPGNNLYCPFGYDPTEDCYVDWLTKGAAVDALEYLRELYKAGALYWGSDLMQLQATFDSSLYASTYQQYLDYDNCTEVLTLNPKYPQVIFTNMSGFAMTQDTPQPQETINLLIDMLFGSEENYLECWLGSSDNYILNSDGTITVEMVQDSEGNYEFPGMPNLAGELSDIFPYSDANILYSKNGVVDTRSDTDTENYNERLNLLNDSLKNGMVVEILPQYQIVKSATYDANSTDTGGWIGFQYIGCFTNAIISPYKTVQQTIDEYKEKMLNLGGNFMLDEMNAAIGRQTAYYYG